MSYPDDEMVRSLARILLLDGKPEGTSLRPPETTVEALIQDQTMKKARRYLKALDAEGLMIVRRPL